MSLPMKLWRTVREDEIQCLPASPSTAQADSPFVRTRLPGVANQPNRRLDARRQKEVWLNDKLITVGGRKGTQAKLYLN